MLCVFVVVISFGCAEQKEGTRPAEKPLIVATIPPIADWCRELVGDAAEVHTLLPAGRSPHAYEPSPRDAQAVASAALIIGWGGHIDDWLTPLADASGRKADVHLLFTADHDGGHDHDHNPHAWLDPQEAAAHLPQLRAQLANFPQLRSPMETRYAPYLDHLQELDAGMQRAAVAWRGHTVVTIHSAWPFFMNRCGVGIAASLHSESGSPPSAKDLQAAIAALANAKTPVVITERQLSAAVAETLARESGATLVKLDAMGDDSDGIPGAYLDMMRGNIAALEAVFGPIDASQ